MKIKIFYTVLNLTAAEQKVNKWLSEHSEIEIKDIKQTYAESAIIITILYKE